MTIYPAAIIVVNADLTNNVQEMIVRQLGIDEILDGYTFDQNNLTDGYYDGYYSADVKRHHKRILVVRPLDDAFDRTVPDIVAFVKAGLIAIEENKFGPHGVTYPIVNLTWGKLGIFQRG